MSFKAKTKTTEDYELPPGGTYPAVFNGLVDLGTHPRDYQGKHWEEHKIYILWELTTEKNSEGENFVVGCDYTFSLGNKANLRKMLEMFRGKPLEDDQEYDVLILMGKPCLLSLSEGISGNKKKFVEVTAVMNPPKGTVVPKPTRTMYVFDFDLWPDFNVDPDVPDWVPMLYGRSVIEEIKKSPEWKAGAAIGIPASGNGQPTTNGSGAKPMSQVEADMALASNEAPF